MQSCIINIFCFGRKNTSTVWVSFVNTWAGSWTHRLHRAYLQIHSNNTQAAYECHWSCRDPAFVRSFIHPSHKFSFLHFSCDLCICLLAPDSLPPAQGLFFLYFFFLFYPLLSFKFPSYSYFTQRFEFRTWEHVIHLANMLYGDIYSEPDILLGTHFTQCPKSMCMDMFATNITVQFQTTSFTFIHSCFF